VNESLLQAYDMVVSAAGLVHKPGTGFAGFHTVTTTTPYIWRP
jgi:hypothetical protein